MAILKLAMGFFKGYWLYIGIAVVVLMTMWRINWLESSLDKAKQQKTACEAREALRQSASDQKSEAWQKGVDGLNDKRQLDLGVIEGRTNQ